MDLQEEQFEKTFRVGCMKLFEFKLGKFVTQYILIGGNIEKEESC